MDSPEVNNDTRVATPPASSVPANLKLATVPGSLFEGLLGEVIEIDREWVLIRFGHCNRPYTFRLSEVLFHG